MLCISQGKVRRLWHCLNVLDGGLLEPILQNSCDEPYLLLLGLCVQVIDAMLTHSTLKPLLAHPSVSYGSNNLYMRGVFEEETKPNLQRNMLELLDGNTNAQLTVNDKKLSAPLRVRLRLT
jgi:hypothetical protein